MDDRTQRIETIPTSTSREVPPAHATREVTAAPATTTEVPTASRRSAGVERRESFSYDPYANRRMAGYRVTQLVYWIFGLVEGLILIRFALKLLGANPAAGFAQLIYGVSAPLVSPFYGLFTNPAVDGSVVELHSIIALVAYALLALLLGRLVWILAGDSRSAMHTNTTEVDTRV